MSAKVMGHGVAASVPDGWAGRVFREVLKGPEVCGPTMHIGNFAIPGDDTGFAGRMMSEVSSGRVAMVLQEYLPDAVLQPGVGLYSANGVPAKLSLADFDPRTLQSVQDGQVGVQRFFTVGRRLFVFYAVLGQSGAQDDGAVAALGSILGGLQLASSPDAGDYQAAPTQTP
jgi:hypothetical protein